MKLEAPFISFLEGESVDDFRQQYRRYRLGESKGARGEVTDIVPGGGEPSTPIEDLGSNIFGASKGTSSQLYADLTKWRLGYRAFRKGEAHGSEGEISHLASKFTRKHLQLLPVSALGELRAFQKRHLPQAPLHGQFHIHFGAGKLGLGLIVPALVASGKKFAILQRLSSTWEPLASVPFNPKNPPTCEIRVNEEFVVSLGIISSKQDPEGRFDFLGSHLQGFIVIADDDHILCQSAAKIADTASTALGPYLNDCKSVLEKYFARQVEHALDKIHGRDKGVFPIFCCENDHKAIDNLHDELSRSFVENASSNNPTTGDVSSESDSSSTTSNNSTNSAFKNNCQKKPIAVVHCMVDRICSERHIQVIAADENTSLIASINITAEPYQGEIVVQAAPLNGYGAPFAGKNVRTPTLSSTADYFSNRKILLVNGLHTVIAFMTLCAKEVPPPKGTAYVLGDVSLLSATEMTAAQKLMLKIWMVGRTLLVFFEHDMDVIMEAHGLKNSISEADNKLIDKAIGEVLEYAETAAQRISTVPDSTKRVLGGGVRNRFEGRLLTTKKLLDSFSTPIRDVIVKKTLKIAGVTEKDLRQQVNALVEGGQKFI